MRAGRLLLFAMVASWLVGCGGGGGSADEQPVGRGDTSTAPAPLTWDGGNWNEANWD